MIRILIADDHEVVRSGLRRILEAHPDWEVVAEVADGREAIRKVAETKPDVAVLDYSLPLLNGIEATRQIRAHTPGTEILIFTMRDNDALIEDVLMAGARSSQVPCRPARPRSADAGGGLLRRPARLRACQPHWSQVIRRDSGEAQLEVVGKGDKVRQVLIPAVIAARLFASRGDAPSSAPVFESVRNPGPCSDRPGRQFHRQGRSQARRRQPGSLGALAPARARQPRHRQRRAHHARVGDARPCGSEDDIGLCPRPPRRELGAILEDEVGSPNNRAALSYPRSVEMSINVSTPKFIFHTTRRMLFHWLTGAPINSVRHRIKSSFCTSVT